MEVPLDIQAASAILEWEWAGLSVPLPEVEVLDSTVAVLEADRLLSKTDRLRFIIITKESIIG